MDCGHGLRRADETILERIVRFGVIGLMSIFMLVAIMGNISVQWSDGIYAIFAILLTAGAMYVFTSFAEKTADAYKMWMIVIFVIAFTLRIIMINAWALEPVSDFKDTYDVALALARADISDMTSVMRNEFPYYYTTWSVHVPFILIKMSIIRIFGEGYHAIQMIFNFFSAMSCVVGAMIAKALYGRRAGILTGLMMCVMPLELMFSAVLSNQHIATFFFLLAIYMLIDNPFKNRLSNIALASVCTAISQLVRPEMIVFIIAVLCYFVYRDVINIRRRRKMKASLKKFAGYCVMFLSIYLILLFTASLAMTESGIVKNKITNTNYKYKIATGLNSESNGLWTEGDSVYADDEEKLDRLIDERMENKWQVVGLAFNKLMYQYGSYDYPWCVEGKTGEFIEKWYGPLTNSIMFVVLLLCLIKVIAAFFEKSRRELLLMTIMVGYFMVFTVIEVQDRYNYFAIPIFIILASGALVRVYEYGRNYVYEVLENHREAKKTA